MRFFLFFHVLGWRSYGNGKGGGMDKEMCVGEHTKRQGDGRVLVVEGWRCRSKVGKEDAVVAAILCS